MYSPKIADELIPRLYHLAKARKVPMTQLVTKLLGEALTNEEPPESAMEAITGFAARPEPRPAAT